METSSLHVKVTVFFQFFIMEVATLAGTLTLSPQSSLILKHLFYLARKERSPFTA